MTQTTSNSRPSALEPTPEVEEIGSLRKHSKNVLIKSGCEIAKVTHTEVNHPEEIAHVKTKCLIDLRKNGTPKSVTPKGSREETVLKTNSEINEKSGRFGGEEKTNHSRHSAGQTWMANHEEPRGLMGHGSKHSKQSLLPKDILRESVLLKLLNNRKLLASSSERNIVNNNSALTKSNILKKNTEYLPVLRPNKTESLPVRGFEKFSISDVSLCLENDSFGLSDERTISLEENVLKEKHFENIFEKQEIEITSIKDKMERLKREIFYLDLMADQKEKEKSLIQQFKEQKEEKLKRIYHKQALITHLTKRKMRKYKKGEASLLSVALEKDESVKKTSCTEETPVHHVSGTIEQVGQPKSISCLQMNQSSYRNLVQNDFLSNDSKKFSQREQAGSTEQQNQILFNKGSVIDLSNTSFSYVTSGTILVPGNQFQNKQFLNPPQRVEIINSSTNAVPLDPNGDQAKSLGQTTFAFLNKMADGYNSSSRQNVVQRRYRKIRPKVPAIAETSSAQKTPNNEISTLSTQGSQPKVLQQVPLFQRNSISIPQSVPLSESITKSGLQRVTHSHESPSNIPYQGQLPQGNFSNVAQSLSLSENIRTGDPQTVPLVQRNSISIPQVLFSQGCLTNNSYQVPLLQRDFTYAPEINAVTVQQQVSLSQETCTGVPQRHPSSEINNSNVQQQVPLSQGTCIGVPQRHPSSEINNSNVQQQVPLSQGTCTGVPQRYPLSEMNNTNVQQQAPLSQGTCTGVPQRYPSSEMNDTNVQQQVSLSPGACTGVPQRYLSSEINDTNVQGQVSLSQGTCTGVPQRYPSSEINNSNVQQQVPLSQGTCTGVPQRYPSSEINNSNVQQQAPLSQGTCTGVPQRYSLSEMNDTNVQQQVSLSPGTCTGVPQRHLSSEINDTNVQGQVSLSQGTCTGVSQRYPSSEINNSNVQQQVPLSQGTCTGVPQRYPSSEMNDTNAQQKVSLSQRTCTGVPQRYPLPKINTQQQVPLSQGTYTSDLQHVHLVKEKPTISSNRDFLVQGSSSNSNNQPIGEKNNNVSTSSEFLNMPTELQCWKLLIACVQAMTNKHSFLSPLMADQNPLLTENLANIFANLNQAIGSKNSLFGQIISNQEALSEMSSALAQDVSFDTIFSQKTNENLKTKRPTTELDNSTPSEQTTFVSAVSTPSGQTTFVSSAPKTSEQTKLVFSAVSTSSGQTTFASAASLTSGQTTFVSSASTTSGQTKLVYPASTASGQPTAVFTPFGQTTFVSAASTTSGHTTLVSPALTASGQPTAVSAVSTPSGQTTFVSSAPKTSEQTKLVFSAVSTSSGQTTFASAASLTSGQTTFVSSASTTSGQTKLVYPAPTASGQPTAVFTPFGQTTFVPAASTPLRQTRIVSAVSTTTGQTTVLSTVSTVSGGSNNSIILSNSSVCGTCGAKDPCYICSGCQKEWYCSMLCQFQNWAQHFKTCRKT
ncbi:uncharacterized protein LOC143244191 isoform X2 [Tachypleus tridentatus]|uniref:uncharacterized protein LOC143244191 isoform X2 n=1 Tax=Tachypleus tridentatus TaxID=6853 RepID=UPI003FD4F7B0